MSTVHPDLAAIAARYNELYKSANEGHIQPADALATLAGLSVTDGSGAVWRIDQFGEFLRAEFAGAPPVKAHASQYVDPATAVGNPEIGAYNVGTHQQPTSPTWENTPPPAHHATPAPTAPSFGHGTTPTFGQTAAAEPAGGFPSGGSAFPAGDPFASAPQKDPFSSVPQAGPFIADPTETDPFATPPSQGIADRTAGPALGNPVGERPARSLSKAEARQERRSTRTGPHPLVEFLSRNRVLVGIVILGICAISFALSRGGGGASDLPTLEEDPGFSAPPAATATRAPSAKPSALPVDQMPSADARRKVLAALESGDRAAIAGVVASTPSAAELARSAAFFAGLDKTGLALTTGPMTASGANVLQTWDVADGAKTVLQVKVTWVGSGGGWKLQRIPLP